MLEINNITIEAINKDENDWKTDTLLENINLKAKKGEIVLLIGPSGGGKSLLTNLLLGLISPHEPTLRITKTDAEHSCYDITLQDQRCDVLSDIYPVELHGRIGIMFQALGLFDDLTVRENLAIANDQSLSPLMKEDFDTWQKDIFSNEKLKLDERVLNSELGPLSGGQRQRVAFARLLAFQPKIRILDEPTAALDPNTTEKVIKLIQETQVDKNSIHEEPGKALLTLIITHDYEKFLPIADRVWFITQDRKIEDHEIPKGHEYYQIQLGANRTDCRKILPEKDYLAHTGKCADKMLDTSLKRSVRALTKGSFPKNPYWTFKFFWILFKLLILRAIPYILLSGFFIGLVATYFSLNTSMGKVQLTTTAIDVEKIAKPLLFDEMLSGFGIVMFRALIPLLTCIFIASRSGTAITAYLSIMRDKDRKQWDAFTTFGIHPTLFFYPQVLVSFVLGCFLLSYMAFFASALGCLLIAVYTNPLCTWFTWVETFWVSLKPTYLIGIFPIFSGFAMFSVKTMCAGVAIASISFFFGTRVRKNSLDTLKYLIKSNIFNIISILVIFFILLIMEAN